MEEVDSIIVHFLKQLDIDIPNEVKSLTDLPVPTIIYAVSKCLNTINPSLKAPQKLPPGISHRIEVAAQIATMCKDLGYKREVGYQTFLYYNESDLRQVFMFLIECLPAEPDTNIVPSTPSDKKSMLWQNIRNKINEELNSVWIPPCCNNAFKRNLIGDHADGDREITAKPSDEHICEAQLLQLFIEMKKLQSEDPKRATLNFVQPEVCNSEESSKSKPMENTAQDEREKIIPKVGIVNLKELKEEAIILRQRLNMLESEKNVMDVELSQVQKSNDRADIEINQLESFECLMKELGITKEEGIDDILKKLKKEVEKLHMKSDECTHRHLTLKSQIEAAKQDMGLLETDRGQRLKKFQVLKETARSLKEEYKTKDESKARLVKEYEKLNRGGTKRSIYTKRIMEIVGNVAKQKIEIEKILGDTRQLQKEINNLNGQLDRSFSIADETLFRDAKRDDQSKKAYKLLALLHSECNTIVSLVNDTGTLAREIVDLEDHIEGEKAKRTEQTLQKIQTDLVQMQNESKNLYKQ